MSRAYAITSARIKAEWQRAGGDRKRFSIANTFELREQECAPLGHQDVRIRVLIVSAEHNIVHAALATPVDIVAAHGGTMYPGNSFLGEVIEVGSCVEGLAQGDIVVPAGTSVFDRYGYAQKTWGFDDSLRGCYAEEIALPARMLMHARLDCGLSVWQIAVLPLRAANAYHLWRRAEDLLRAKVPRTRLAYANVLAFGGGVSELFLMLAKHQGHRAFYCAGNAQRRAALEQMGIEPMDQNAYGRFRDVGGLTRFRGEVKRRTAGVGMHIVCDMFRGPLFDAGLAAASRAGVNVSAGWQLNHQVTYDSSVLSMKQITLDHAHVEAEFAGPAVGSLFGLVFRPPMHQEIYAFEDLPRALEELGRGAHNGFAAIQIARELPERLRTEDLSQA